MHILHNAYRKNQLQSAIRYWTIWIWPCPSSHSFVLLSLLVSGSSESFASLQLFTKHGFQWCFATAVDVPCWSISFDSTWTLSWQCRRLHLGIIEPELLGCRAQLSVQHYECAVGFHSVQNLQNEISCYCTFWEYGFVFSRVVFNSWETFWLSTGILCSNP